MSTRVVLASDDLNAQARILAATERAGVELVTAGPTGFADRMVGAVLLILDLDRGREDALAELGGLDPPPPVIGFLSHVDGALARAAREAGCRTYPRGRFWTELPALLAGL
jgi:hypothetical protein